MASVYKHRDRWYLRYRDHRGKWRSKATSAQSKTEAKRMAQELGMHHVPSRLIVINRSYDRETTKGGKAEAIPIARELIPYLRAAFATSPSPLVFPDPSGRMLSRHTPLEDVLPRALWHSGIVEGTGCRDATEA